MNSAIALSVMNYHHGHEVVINDIIGCNEVLMIIEDHKRSLSPLVLLPLLFLLLLLLHLLLLLQRLQQQFTATTATTAAAVTTTTTAIITITTITSSSSSSSTTSKIVIVSHGLNFEGMENSRKEAKAFSYG